MGSSEHAEIIILFMYIFYEGYYHTQERCSGPRTGFTCDDDGSLDDEVKGPPLRGSCALFKKGLGGPGFV